MKINMSDEIVNKVAKSNLITIELKAFRSSGDRIELDIKKWLHNELILKEKEFRIHLKEHDWSIYKNKLVALYCSIDTIIPAWAFVLVTTHLQSYAKHIAYGNMEEMEKQLFQENINQISENKYADKKVLIKGCSDVYIPDAAYVMISNKLLPVVKSLMFGEACSNVPIYKKQR